jgi:DNA-binding PadR family transcriptional regulator
MSNSPAKSVRQPWNTGRVLTSTPTLGTVRRWLRATAAEGLIERKEVRRTGRPGRPAMQWGLTEQGRTALPRVPAAVQRMQLERIRRQENLWKRRREQRGTQAIAAAQDKATKARRKLRAAEARVETLTAKIIDAATRTLIEANGNASALLPGEVDLLLEHGCARRDGDCLVLNEEWAAAWQKAHEPARGRQAKPESRLPSVTL